MSERCGVTIGSRPFWYSPDQYSQCTCQWPAGHEPVTGRGTTDGHSCGACEDDVPDAAARFHKLRNADLHKALEAAQDEIEARILASERDRELIRQLGVVVEHMAPAAYKAIMAAGGVV